MHPSLLLLVLLVLLFALVAVAITLGIVRWRPTFILNQTSYILSSFRDCSLGIQVVWVIELPSYDQTQGFTHPRTILRLKVLSKLSAIHQWLQLV